MAALPSAAEPPSSDGLGAVNIDEFLEKAAQDEQDEWEYEYSSTETETYYLTLDLSYPEFKERPAKVNYYSRGGYYKNWLDPGSTSTEPATEPRRQDALDEDQSEVEQGNDDDDYDHEGNDEGKTRAQIDTSEAQDLSYIDPLLRGNVEEQTPVEPSGPKIDSKGKRPVRPGNESEPADSNHLEDVDGDGAGYTISKGDIQVLNLHSANPIISYRDRIFEGQWAEVIGTEAIFCRHEEEETLPALRNLAGDVDLLAASCARIITKEKVFEPKKPEADPLAPIRDEWNIRIPLGRHKALEKVEQARFLENLMALKIKKGEKDNVTVFAKGGAGVDFQNDGTDMPQEKPKRQKRSSARERSQGEAARGPGRPRARPGRPRGSQSRGRAPRAVGGLGRGEVVIEGIQPSMPTPRRWDELAAGEAGGRKRGISDGDDGNDVNAGEDAEDSIMDT